MKSKQQEKELSLFAKITPKSSPLLNQSDTHS